MTTNRRILFARKPEGLPMLEDFAADSAPVAEPSTGQFLVQNLYLAIEPYYRNVMKGMALYGKPLQPGDVMFGETLSRVLVSRHDGYVAGELVVARGGWQEYALLDGTAGAQSDRLQRATDDGTGCARYSGTHRVRGHGVPRPAAPRPDRRRVSGHRSGGIHRRPGLRA